MITADLISSLSETHGITKAESKELYEDLTSVMQSKFAKEGGVTINNFGRFTVKMRKSRVSYNPSDNEFWKLPQKLVLNFSPSLKLKNHLG